MENTDIDYLKTEIDAIEKVIKSLEEIKTNLGLLNDDWIEFRILRLKKNIELIKDRHSDL